VSGRGARLLRGLLAILVAASALAVTGTEGREPHFRYERPVLPGGAGPNRLEPDVPLLAGALPLDYAPGDGAGGLGTFRGGLGDLRFEDAAGREVPYLLVAPSRREPEWREGRLLPIAATKTTSGFEVDFGSAGTIDRLRITGLPAPFLKRFRLEGGGDRSRWTLLVPEGTLFDLPDERLRLLDVPFPAGAAGEYRYLRLTWNDASSGRLPLPGGVAARLVRPVAPGPPPLVPVAFERRPSEPGKSRFHLRLPAARLPLQALDLAVPGGPLLRPAVVTEGRLASGGDTEITPVRLGEATLRRAVRGDLAAADLRIPLALPAGPDLELTVDDGNNPPLPLSGVTAELAPLPWIYFEASAAPLTARFGDRDATSPRYDLEALRDQVGRAPTTLARWGEVRDREPKETVSAASPLPTLGAPVDTAKFRYRRQVPAVLPGLTSLLLDAEVLSRSPGLADPRIADAQGRQVPYLLERRDEPLSLPLPALARRAAKGDPPALSRYRIDLPYPSLPAARLVVATPARVFEREVRLVERPETPEPQSGRREPGEPREQIVAQSTWRHADPETPAPQLTLEVPPSPSTHFDLLVEEGDNSPLPLDPPHLLLPANRLRFFAPAGAALTLLYGQPELSPPRYDLSLLAPRLLGEAAHEIALGPAPYRAPEPDATAQGRKIFWGALVGAVLVLLVLLARLLRGPEGTRNAP
jgi:hypothetical protein